MNPLQASQSSDVSDDVPIKRPPEDDEEPYDLNRAPPPKRQALEPAIANAPGPTPWTSSEDGTGHHQLRDKSPEELVAIINSMQASHAQQVADLRTQYAVVSSQLEQMKGLIDACFASQTRAIQSVQRDIASICKPQLPAQPPMAMATPVAATPDGLNAPTSSSFSTPHLGQYSTPRTHPNPASVRDGALPAPRRDPLGSPSNQKTGSATGGSPGPPKPREKVELKFTPSANANEPPIVEQSSLDTVPEVWEEWRYGRDGNPSLESIDALWGPRWRPDPRIRVWYGRRKAILDQIRKYMADGIDEKTAVTEVENMRCGRTLHWLSRILLDNRKQTKKQWKEAQKAATAARQAMEGGPVA